MTSQQRVTRELCQSCFAARVVLPGQMIYFQPQKLKSLNVCLNFTGQCACHMAAVRYLSLTVHQPLCRTDTWCDALSQVRMYRNFLRSRLSF